MSSSSSSSSAFLSSLPEDDNHHVCYVHCHLCDTILAVSVPVINFTKTSVTVRCGHCSNFLSVNTRSLLFPHTNSLLSPPHNVQIMDETQNSHTWNALMMMNPQMVAPLQEIVDAPKPPSNDKTPEKRQKIPSAYNRFIRDEIQRIKAKNPEINHKEAFSTAAKNWAHYPHIHFQHMPEQHPGKRTDLCLKEGKDAHMNDGAYVSASFGVSPY